MRNGGIYATVLALLLLGAFQGALAQTSNQTSHPLSGELQRIVGQGVARSGDWSLLAVSLDRGDTLFHMNGSTPLVPASNTKLLTTAAALHSLGADFRYLTYVVADGRVEGNTLHGDLVLFGTGDPSLSDRFGRSVPDPLEALADQLDSLGIDRVTGDLVADGSFLLPPGRFDEWELDDLDDWFSAPVGGLSYNENLVTLRTTPGPVVGAPPTVEVMPSGGREIIDNRAVTSAGGSRPDLIITRESPQGAITLLGRVFTSNRPIWKRLPVTDPARFTGMAFESLLQERGIRIEGLVRPVEDNDGSPLGSAHGPERGRLEVLATHRSRPLVDLLAVVNKESNNFYAETVFKTLGRIVEGDGTFDGGRRAVNRFLTRTVGVPEGEVRQRDGSGLSPQNLASAGAFVQLLMWAHDSPIGADLFETLPEAGRRRELPRMYRTAAAGNLRAKTGTLSRVSSLSGYVTTRDGETVAFSIISNGLRSRSAAKRLEDRIGEALASFRR